ncbi:MAG: hypothetical protein KKD17_02855 [Nanoarchaeota archaeon]|nr:hypothetical protein [Nanoarchaeota archaeon]
MVAIPQIAQERAEQELKTALGDMKTAYADLDALRMYFGALGVRVSEYNPRDRPVDDLLGESDLFKRFSLPKRRPTTSTQPARLELVAEGVIPIVGVEVKLYLEQSEIPATTLYGEGNVKSYASRGKVRQLPFVSVCGHIGGEIYIDSWLAEDPSAPIVREKRRGVEARLS